MTERAVPVPHPQVAAYLAAAPAAPLPWECDIGTLRRQTRQQAMAVRGDLEPVAAVEPVSADGVPARLYRPIGEERQVLVWVHGGGWIHGDLDSYEGVARALANRASCAVLAVDYRLAPEHRFPAAFDDVWTATKWALRRFERVAVGGDSSGGNLAAGVALKARLSTLSLAAQLLIYPVLDSAEDTDFKHAFRTGYADFAGQRRYGQDAYERIKYLWQTYIPQVSMRVLPFASPLQAPTLRGVAPVALVTAEHDILRGEAEQYAQRLEAEGVPVELHNYPGQIHGFFQMRGVLADAHSAIDVAGRSLHTMLTHGPPGGSSDVREAGTRRRV